MISKCRVKSEILFGARNMLEICLAHLFDPFWLDPNLPEDPCWAQKAQKFVRFVGYFPSTGPCENRQSIAWLIILWFQDTVVTILLHFSRILFPHRIGMKSRKSYYFQRPCMIKMTRKWQENDMKKTIKSRNLRILCRTFRAPPSRGTWLSWLTPGWRLTLGARGARTSAACAALAPEPSVLVGTRSSCRDACICKQFCQK